MEIFLTLFERRRLISLLLSSIRIFPSRSYFVDYRSPRLMSPLLEDRRIGGADSYSRVDREKQLGAEGSGQYANVLIDRSMASSLFKIV